MSTNEFNKVFSKNLNFYIKEKDISQAELAKEIGVSATSVGNWCNGLKTPRMDKVDKIAEFFHIKRSDLMVEKETVSPATVHGVKIPVLGSVPAGIAIEAIQDIVDEEEIPLDWLNGDHEYFALRVTGDSMFPKYQEGDTIIIRKQDDCESGQDCVVYVNGYDATLKKVIKNLDHIILQPLNPAYEPKIFDYNDMERPVKIAGVVVELRRKI